MSASHGPSGGVAKRVFEIIPGIYWPSADEHGLHAVGTAWREAADAVESVAAAGGAATGAVMTASQGLEFAKLAAFWAAMDNGSGAGHLPDTAKACRQLAEACDHLADQVSEIKHKIIVELTVAAAVILASVAVCWIPFVGEAAAVGAAATAAALVSTTAAIGITLSTVAASIAATVIVGAVMGALTAITVDLVVAQPIKMAFGDQDWGHWNAGEVLTYAEGGAVGGGFAGGLSGAASLAGGLSESMAATAPTVAKGLNLIPSALETGVGQVLAGSGVNAATGYVLNGQVSGMDLVTGAAGAVGGRVAGPGAERGPLLDEVSALSDPTSTLGQAADGGLRARLAGLARLRELINDQGKLPSLPDGWQADATFRPAEGSTVSGDVLMARLSGDGATLGVFGADAAGHGVVAAPTALTVSDALGEPLAASPGSARLISLANDEVNRIMDLTGSYETLMPALHLGVDLRTGEFTLADAGFTYASHFHAETGEWQLLTPESHTQNLGMLPVNDGALIPGHLAPGDALLTYTDGLVETRRGNLEHDILDMQALAGPLIREGHPSPAEIIAAQLGARGERVLDDVSLFYLRRPVPGEETPTFWTRLRDRASAIDWADETGSVNWFARSRRAGPDTPTATEWDIPTWTTLRRGEVEFVDRQLKAAQVGENGSNFPFPPKGYPTAGHDFEWRIGPSSKLRPSSQSDAYRQLLNNDNGRGIVYLHNGGRGELWNAANFDGVPRFFRGPQEVFWTQDISNAYHEIWFMKTGW